MILLVRSVELLKIVIASSRNSHYSILGNRHSKADFEVFWINEPAQLTNDYLSHINPKYIFFPHWSYYIPKAIYDNYECIIFHMTDVPFGRGGSPLQNLISRGIYETKISAILCEEALDAGPVYLKQHLSLYGTAEEIFLRAQKIIEEMIIYIIENKPKPEAQQGDQVVFIRRKQEDGYIGSLDDLNKVFDFIRMLDAEGYPPAFIDHEGLKFEFTRASFKGGYILADVKITKRGESNE
jgi:methionyl-tRNA formyltransferase